MFTEHVELFRVFECINQDYRSEKGITFYKKEQEKIVALKDFILKNKNHYYKLYEWEMFKKLKEDYNLPKVNPNLFKLFTSVFEKYEDMFDTDIIQKINNHSFFNEKTDYELSRFFEKASKSSTSALQIIVYLLSNEVIPEHINKMSESMHYPIEELLNSDKIQISSMQDLINANKFINQYFSCSDIDYEVENNKLKLTYEDVYLFTKKYSSKFETEEVMREKFKQKNEKSNFKFDAFHHTYQHNLKTLKTFINAFELLQLTIHDINNYESIIPFLDEKINFLEENKLKLKGLKNSSFNTMFLTASFVEFKEKLEEQLFSIYDVFNGLHLTQQETMKELTSKLLSDKKKKKKYISLLKSMTKDDFVFLNYESSKAIKDYPYYVNTNLFTKESFLETLKNDNDFIINLKNFEKFPVFESIEEFNLYQKNSQKRKVHLEMIKDGLKVDERIRLLKFIELPRTLETIDTFEGFVEKLIAANKIQNIIHFYKPYKEKGFTKENALFIHLYKEKYPILKEVKNNEDVNFLLINDEFLTQKNSLEKIKENFIAESASFKQFIRNLNVTEEWVKNNYTAILTFFLSNKYKIYNAYRTLSSPNQLKNLMLIIKADIVGKLNYLQYNLEGIIDEVEFGQTIDMNMLKKWVEHQEYQNKYTIKQVYDFETLMEMGEKPTYSCMSYQKGMYRQCLLSIFDGNKHLIGIYDKGKLVGRAILRFTKISDKLIGKKSVGFIDVTDEVAATVMNQENAVETPIIFLERLYTSYTGEQAENMVNDVLSFLKQKATSMNVDAYHASHYSNNVVKVKNTYMFISHSKNGEQYLDSLGGSKDSSAGGQYLASKIIKL